VGRDVLIGMAAGAYFLLVSFAAPLVTSSLAGMPPPPIASSVQYLLGFRYTLAPIIRVVPNVLQTAMITTFVYVVLLAMVRRRSIAVTALLVILTGVVMAEASDEPLWVALGFALLVGVPIIFVFVRYGLLASATGLLVNQVGHLVPLTSDVMRPHSPDAAFVLILLLAIAAYGFSASGAGEGLLRRLTPEA
jgi:hypothetical protein